MARAMKKQSRSRAGNGQERGSSTAGAGQEEGRSRAGTGLGKILFSILRC